MKYKIGDKVRVRQDLKLGTHYYMQDSTNWNCVTTEMMELGGKEVTISEFHNGQYVIFESFWHRTDEMFELSYLKKK